MAPRNSTFNPVRVRFSTMSELASAVVYITPFIESAEEVIAYSPTVGEKYYQLTSIRELATKVVYLQNPDEVKKHFCIECGAEKRGVIKMGVKVFDNGPYCCGSFCEKIYGDISMRELLRSLK